MATVKYDIINGNSGRRDSKGWSQYDRIAIVEGVTGTGDQKLDNAVSALDPIGTPHPSISGLWLREFSPEAETPDTVRVRMHYSRFDKVSETEPPETTGLIEIGSSVNQVETNKDHAGDLIELSYTYQDSNEFEMLHGGENDGMDFPYNDTVSEPFSKLAPNYKLTVHITLTGSPGSDAVNYVGKINSTSWRGGAAKTWLCTGIRGTSRDGGVNYSCSYEFEYNPNTWDTDVYYTFPRTGKFPNDTQITANPNSAKTVQIYDAVDFGGLPV